MSHDPNCLFCKIIAYAIHNILELRARRNLNADQLSLALPEPEADPAPAAAPSARLRKTVLRAGT